jgi:hypothetical protein
MERIDVVMAKGFLNVTGADFLGALGDRMLSETVAELCSKKYLVANKTLLKNLARPICLVPWHITERSKEKANSCHPSIRSTPDLLFPLFVSLFDKTHFLFYLEKCATG